jgi:hypothetical protein
MVIFSGSPHPKWQVIWNNSPGREIELHEELWAGVLLKVEHAGFHFDRMGQSIQPPERTHYNVALEASGTILDTGWQRSFYAYFDAFLSAARSVPEILQCCFGHDPNHRMKAWFDALPPDEQRRRKEFSARFAPALSTFRSLDLGAARQTACLARTGSRALEPAIAAPPRTSPPSRPRCRQTG